MRQDKNLAIKLRRQNKSYNEISKTLKISKSTLSSWFKNSSFSKKIKNTLTRDNNRASSERIRLLADANSLRWKRWRQTAREEAKKEFKNFKKNPLFLAGLLLYWAEGDNKERNPFRITNTDPRMIALFVKFLLRILNIPRENIRIALILYPDLSNEECVNFWSKITNIPKGQFYKTQFIKGRHRTRRLSYGICMVICGNGQLKEKVLTWIDLLSKTL